ncbi:MAG: hydroxyacid dehydrogenase [Planctomycetes bacterium]|nr:hydroxyacid dehydrogenase [Planctomycetota bacterium]
MKFTVLIPEGMADNGRAFLRERGYLVKTGSGSDEASVLRDIVDVDAVLVSHEAITRKIMEAGKKLKCVARFGVGYDSVDIPAATELGIQVTYTPYALTNAVGEHTIALLLACAKHIVAMDKCVREGKWNVRNDNRRMSTEVKGKTLGLVGLGRIGMDVAEKARLGLGMNVIAYDPYCSVDRFPEGVIRVADLGALFAAADFVSLHMPSTPETRGMITRDLFARMRPGSFFINCARGDVVNEADLVVALKNGPMAAAALDVLVDEPPLADNPLLTLDNVILLPHTASFTPETRDAMGMTAAQSIDDVLSGRQPAYPVNRLAEKNA